MEKYIGTTEGIVNVDNQVRTKEQAIELIKKGCREQGCNCDPKVDFIRFEVDSKDTKAEVNVIHKQTCPILVAARA